MRRQIRCEFAALAAAAMVATLGFAGAGGAAAAAPGHGAAPTQLLAAGRAALPALVPGARLWASRYNGAGNGPDTGWSVAFSPGKVFAAGQSYSGSATKDDVTLLAYNSVTGARLWAKTYDAPAGGHVSVAVSPDGSRVYLTGLNATLAYNANTGALLWSASFGGTNVALAVAGDGTRVFATGSASREETSLDFATAAYNAATGAQLWIRYYNGRIGSQNGDDDARAISAGGDRVFVTGASPGTGESDLTTVAYNAATGTQLWVGRYHTPGAALYDSSSAVAVSPDHTRVFVTGTGFRPDFNSDYATVAYNAATGAQQWVKRYNGPGNAKDYGHAVTVAGNGSKVFVTGESAGGTSTGQDYATIAYNAANGAQLWVGRYHGTGSGFDSANAVVSPGNGKVYITGVSYGGAVTNRDYATVAYRNSDGKQLWASRYNGPGNRADSATAIAANSGGTKVFVTGGSRGTSSQDYMTLGYGG